MIHVSCVSCLASPWEAQPAHLVCSDQISCLGQFWNWARTLRQHGLRALSLRAQLNSSVVFFRCLASAVEGVLTSCKRLDALQRCTQLHDVEHLSSTHWARLRGSRIHCTLLGNTLCNAIQTNQSRSPLYNDFYWHKSYRLCWLPANLFQQHQVETGLVAGGNLIFNSGTAYLLALTARRTDPKRLAPSASSSTLAVLKARRAKLLCLAPSDPGIAKSDPGTMTTCKKSDHVIHALDL